MRKICAITERRADYSRLKPVLRKIQEHPNLELSVIVTGTHLLPELGNTIDLIKKDGFPIDHQFPMFSKDEKDTGADMSRALGRAIIGIADGLEKIAPDIVLVGFDLGAHLAGAIAGAHMNIPVAHIQGGEITGTIDESIRHAITKFAHIHFAATPLSAKRIIKMGEDPKYVFSVGCPALDVIKNTKKIEPVKLEEEFGVDLTKPLIILVQHPVTTEVDKATDQILTTLSAVKRVNEQTILIFPNVDAGGRHIIEAIKKTKIKRFPNLPFEKFISLMSVADVIVGNSSSGIREAASFEIPAVNIGTRQNGRERPINVLDVNYNEEEIYKAVKKALYDKKFRDSLKNCHNPYGDGKSAQRIVTLLASIDLKPNLVQKKLLIDVSK